MIDILQVEESLPLRTLELAFSYLLFMLEVGLVTHITRLEIDLICWFILWYCTWKAYKKGAILHKNSTKKVIPLMQGAGDTFTTAKKF